MILVTMTPEEKYLQMKKVYTYLNNTSYNNRNRVYKILSKTKIFPTFYTEEKEIPDMGTWTIVYEAESKGLIRKGIVSISAYQKYYIYHSKDVSNNGVGIYLLSGDGCSIYRCFEISPHYFNRFRERYVTPKGITQPSFTQLVKMVLRVHYHSINTWNSGYYLQYDKDGKYSFVKDNTMLEKEGYGNVIMYHKDGLSLGIFTCDRGYVNCTTFISDNLLKDDQKDYKKRMMEEIRKYEYHLKLDPFAVYDDWDYIVHKK